MRRLLGSITIAFVVFALLVPLAPAAAATGSLAALVTTIETFSWSPPSPDPSGVAWWASKGRLIVVDGEVEETMGGITHYAGVNTWEVTTSGGLLHTSTTYPAFSSEPTDVAADGSTVFFVDDNADEVFIVDVGGDGELGTADDTRASFDTRAFNSHDPEGLAFGDGSLFVSDGNNNQVYRVDPGSNGLFDGTDDQVSCFDTSVLGMRDPEGVTMDPVSGELYIISRTDREVAIATPSGVLTDLISLAGVLPFTTAPPVNPAGVAIAPASNDASRSDLYISDRAVDNNTDPNEVDGKVYEIRLDPPAGNVAPVVSGPGAQTVVEGESVRLQVVAADPNDDPITYSATGLPPGLTIDPATGVITGTLPPGSASAVAYASTLKASDATLTGSRNANWTVLASGSFNTAPSITGPGDQLGAEGDAVNLPIVASDPDALNVLMYSATGLPPGLWMNCVTGAISGTIPPGASSGSPYTVRVSVSDQVVPGGTAFRSKWDAQTFTWTVNPADPAPAAPTGLVVTPESVGLQLDWADNTELDLAGYNVYRIDGGTPARLNGALPLTTSAYLDTGAPPGQTSDYQVTAVDLGGNESAPAEMSAQRGTIVSHGSASAARVSATLPIATPSGAIEGDVMVAAVNIASGAAITPPAGWEHVRTEGSGTSLRQAVYVKVVGAGEPSSHTWTFAGSVAASGVIVAYEGVDTTAPVVATSAGQANGRSASISAPSVEAVSSQLLVGFFGMPTNAQITPPAGMVEQAEALVNGKKKVSIEASDDVLVADGATGARSALANKPAVSVGQVIVLRPAP